MNRTVSVAVLALLFASPGAAQTPQQRPPQAEEGFAQHLFPPELVMQRAQEIRLSAAQRQAITEAMQRFQTTIIDLQWKMQEETQRLNDLLETPRVDEAAVLSQVDRVLATERDVKRAHLTLLVRIKNVLTPEQQESLQAHRRF